ncbi:MAG: UDP-N-acetylglucosamine--N-acetylmuramyl-(pentapeptide) pyrophosphoryl-undecaprenol N-acetylglucosamine transferase [Chloroflexota bacterium]
MPNPTLITGGGTGGHVYPALSVIPHLLDRPSSAPETGKAGLIYIGNSAGLEQSLVSRDGIHAHFFSMAPPYSARGLALLALATVRTLGLLLRSRPRVSFATGGYVSVPAVIASWLLRVPVVIFLPDVKPGRAVRALLPFARRIAVSTDAGLAQLGTRKGRLTGYPLREAFIDLDKGKARRRLNLPLDAKVVCVFGGSQGARNLNRALAACLATLLERAYVIHLAGEALLPEAEAASSELSSKLRSHYRLYPYLADDDMAAALAASDLAVCRSGASVLGELPITGTPAILVPLPEGRVHQRENAEYLASRGAAIILPDAELDRLCEEVESLLGDDAKLSEMGSASAALSRPFAARDLAAVIEEACS